MIGINSWHMQLTPHLSVIVSICLTPLSPFVSICQHLHLVANIICEGSLTKTYLASRIRSEIEAISLYNVPMFSFLIYVHPCLLLYVWSSLSPSAVVRFYRRKETMNQDGFKPNSYQLHDVVVMVFATKPSN